MTFDAIKSKKHKVHKCWALSFLLATFQVSFRYASL